MALQGMPIWVAVPLMLIIGGGIGALNGLLVTKARINAVIATLGVGTILTGLGFAYSPFPIVTNIPAGFSQLSLGRLIPGVPNSIPVMIVVLAVLWIILNKTNLGIRMQAVGGNAEAARLSGIRVDRVKIFAFATAGVCAAITGVMLSSLLGSGTLASADGYLLDAFAAVFLGSATLRDGEFHIVGTLVGVLIISVGFNGLSIFGAPSWAQQVFSGGILVLAVGLATLSRRYLKTT
jgi:ribose transport system permease protein